MVFLEGSPDQSGYSVSSGPIEPVEETEPSSSVPLRRSARNLVGHHSNTHRLTHSVVTRQTNMEQ